MIGTSADSSVLTLPQHLREHARLRPDGVAIRQKRFGIWQPTTWAQYWTRSRHVGLGLRELGIQPGAHVGVLSENRIEWVLTQMGVGCVRAVTVGVYPTSPAPEVAYVLDHADVEVVVCEDQEQVDKVLECWDQLPRLKTVVAIETKGLRAYDRSRVIPFDEVEAMGAAVDARQPGLVDRMVDAQVPSDPALLIYTSGSTGKPKGAVISYRNIAGILPALVERLDMGPGDSVLSYLPLCHVAEQSLTTFAPIQLGTTVNFGESLRTVQLDLREVAPTLFLGVPRIWEKMHSAIHIKAMEAGRFRRALFAAAVRACEPFCETGPRSLGQRLTYGFWYLLVFRALLNFIGLRRSRICISGAAPIPPKVFRFFRILGVPLIELYGQTETSGGILGHRPDDVRTGTVGVPVPNAELTVAEDGELLVRGPMVFEGYYKNPAATQATIVDGWLHTGDVVTLVDGHFKIVDRKKDVIITSGGKNLSPSEIENAMKASPFIKECVVVGDGRKYVAALIQIDYENVGKWAEQKDIPFTTFRSLAEHPAVVGLIASEVEAANQGLAQVEQVKRFHLLTKELDHDDDEVTATMKIRRSNIYKKYEAEIAALYAEREMVA